MGSYKYLSLFSVIIVVLALFFGIFNSYTTFFNSSSSAVVSKPQDTVFTAKELSQFNGIAKPALFLAILGIVYNVTKGVEHYGNGKSYNIFVGRDASRSFVTGKFDEEFASDDLTGLSTSDILSITHWTKFYKQNYNRVGKLSGRYYDTNGQPTSYNKEIRKLIKAAESQKHNQELENMRFPPCNVEWDAELGRSRVWCTRRSGGVERSWVGVPRQLYEPGSDSFRCACINDENRNAGNIREYEGCNPSFDSCDVKVS